MQERLLNPLEYKKVLKQATVEGERENGLCCLKCKKLKNVSTSDYLKYCYMLTAILCCVFTGIFCGVLDYYYLSRKMIAYLGDDYVYVFFMAACDMCFFVEVFKKYKYELDKWEDYEQRRYSKSPSVAFNFLKHDFYHFFCIEPMDSVFHWFHLVIVLVLLRFYLIIPALVYLCLFLMVDIIELYSTRRNVLNMKYALQNEDLLISGNPFIFPNEDLELYTGSMGIVVKLHTLSKLWRISQLGVFLIFVSLSLYNTQ